MYETVGDIWSLAGVKVITTNGSLTRDGRAIIGRGVAREAANRYPGLAAILGSLIAAQGSHVYIIDDELVSFPVEETAWSQPDLNIIARSARELRELADTAGWQSVIVPRPGCGGGGLVWRDVQPYLEPWFDERFVVIHRTSDR